MHPYVRPVLACLIPWHKSHSCDPCSAIHVSSPLIFHTRIQAEQCTPPKPPLDAAPKGFGLGLAPKPPDTAPKAAPEDCPKVPKEGWEAAPKGALPNPKPAFKLKSKRVRCLH